VTLSDPSDSLLGHQSARMDFEFVKVALRCCTVAARQVSEHP
jgi:hypothetical protein